MPFGPCFSNFVEQDGLARTTIIILLVTTVGCATYTWGYYEGYSNGTSTFLSGGPTASNTTPAVMVNSHKGDVQQLPQHKGEPQNLGRRVIDDWASSEYDLKRLGQQQHADAQPELVEGMMDTTRTLKGQVQESARLRRSLSQSRQHH